LLEHKYKPEDAIKPFLLEPYPFLEYRDASYTISDCINGLYKAINYGWLEYEYFNVDLYEENYNNNLNYKLINSKFIAFQSPSDKYNNFEPIEYINVFKKKMVNTVIRLNEPLYDKNIFIKNDIKHHDLYFDDCTEPPINIVKKFVKICNNSTGVIAIHCKSGIGRTGTLIAIWLLLNYEITAKEVIGFLRIVRPGCVIERQQQYLEYFYENLCKNNKRLISLHKLISK
jgi:cell division cycle 14